MLNLSENTIEGRIDTSKYRAFSMTRSYKAGRIFSRVLMSMFFMVLIILFLPWTQNIRSKGYVTTLKPDQRPQTIHSIIPGRIEKWYVREGDFLHKGDTILQISEIKDAYFDPELVNRTQQQVNAKQSAVNGYKSKVEALESQIEALKQTKSLKLKQANNYIKQAELSVYSDSVEFQAALTAYSIAEKQFARQQKLYDDGLKSLTDLEKRQQKFQDALAKKISSENKLLASRNKLINAIFEKQSVLNQYNDKLAKAQSDKFSALTQMYDGQAMVTKLENQLQNYSIRQGYHFITANQDGYVTKAIRSGIGETVKEGEQLVSIMPVSYDFAVSMYVKPMNLPLVEKGQHVRFMFDGWPSVVFSGWPNVSYGTFGGEVVAIDNFTSPNGKYRIMVAPDPDSPPWPKELRVGSGANGFALLKDVPIWYEIWRQLNGFPPDYYKTEKQDDIKQKKKILK